MRTGHWHSWRRNLAFFLGSLLLIILGLVFNSPTSWLVTDLAITAVFFSLLSLAAPLARLQVTTSARKLSATSNKSLRFQLKGRGFFAKLAVRADQRTLWQGPYFGRARDFHWPNQLTRGVYTELPLTLQAWDLLGCATKQRHLTLKQPLIVGPAAEPALSQALIAVLADFVKHANADDLNPSFDLESLRDYRPGNPLHAIDWKISAKRGKTTIRQDRPEQKPIWAGVLLATAAPAFESLLGAFTTLDQETKLWEQGYYLGQTSLNQPSWTQLAQFQANSEQNWVSPEALQRTPALIVFSAAATSWATASQQFPLQKLILVQVTPTTITVNNAQQQVTVPREALS
ncbi:DUF58 domain-containing protein [Lapidilactobacillus luobeiensis]|uniref:DUF58 domain-containing protein n=1 Tax=Lapidilactobacillus luobeiensis TaxID=2950371 RepID=UPI0021C46E0E|nr:DUF58 domain-containing protein [Lapidilactobacillus luobeiensis]